MTKKRFWREVRRNLVLALVIGAAFFALSGLVYRYGPMGHTTAGTKFFADGSTADFEVWEARYPTSNRKSGRVKYTYYNSLHEPEWEAELEGSFLFDGTTSMCVESNASVEMENSAWDVLELRAGMEGNSALGHMELERTMLGVRTAFKILEMQLTCDANGNLK